MPSYGFILQNMRKIEEIYVTLDSHHRMHIARSIFWENEEGESRLSTTITGKTSGGETLDPLS